MPASRHALFLAPQYHTNLLPTEKFIMATCMVDSECMHGGRCVRKNEADFYEPATSAGRYHTAGICLCKSGFSGSFCENGTEKSSCKRDVECFNGGTCRLATGERNQDRRTLPIAFVQMDSMGIRVRYECTKNHHSRPSTNPWRENRLRVFRWVLCWLWPSYVSSSSSPSVAYRSSVVAMAQDAAHKFRRQVLALVRDEGPVRAMQPLKSVQFWVGILPERSCKS